MDLFLRVRHAQLFGLLPLVLTGCSLSPSPGATSTPSLQTGAAIRGSVYGGEVPIGGSHIYLLEANTSTYGGPGIAPSSSNASVSLLSSTGAGTTLDTSGGATNGFYYVTSSVLPGSYGDWTITDDYSCTPGEQVYLYSLGGGPSGGSANSAAGLLAALGNCPAGGTFSPSLFIPMNEISTVAAAYAMAGFASDALHVSTSGSVLGQLGLLNAFANAANLETLTGIGAGTAPATTTGGNGTVPQAEINTLANILAACVSTSGPGSSQCTTLFGDAKSAGSTGTLPGDTATAAINIAHNPAANVAALYALPTGTPPFAPTLTSVPNDFTIALNFSGGGIATPSAIAIDSIGDAWIANNGSTASVTELSPLGVALHGSPFTVGGLQSPSAIAVDLSGNVWVANNYNAGSITGLTSTGTALSGSPFTGGGVNEPEGIAVDGSNHIWAGNNGEFMAGDVSVYADNGSAISGASGYGPGFGIADEAIAVDSLGDIWTINGYITGVQKFVVNIATGALISDASYEAGINDPTSLAIDASNQVWIATHGSYVQVLKNNGTALAQYTGGGVHFSSGIAMDGASNAWIANTTFSLTTPGFLSEFSNGGTAITPSTGYTSSTMISSGASSLALDSSGDVWVANNGNSTVSEFIGAAVPVTTPLAYAVQFSLLGTRP
jgi:hypothetical protein